MFREKAIRRISVFKDYNRLLQDYYFGIGWIHDEDSVYTMILPDNEAWDKAYEQVSPYSKFIMPMRLWRILSRECRLGRPLCMD